METLPLLSRSFFRLGLSLFNGIVLLILTLSSCKKELGNLGLDAIPKGDLLEVSYSSGQSIIARCVLDSPTVSTTKFVMLGSAYDDVFGKSSASFYAQISPVNFLNDSSFAATFNDAIIDSLVFSLQFNPVLAYIYGNGNKNLGAQKVTIYQVTEDLFSDTAYKSNRQLSYDESTPLGQGWIYPSFADSVSVSGTNQAPQIRIKLSQQFATFLKQSASLEGGMQLRDAETFVKFFKGIYVKAENPSESPGSGCFYYFDLSALNSGLRMYYRTETFSDNVFFRCTDQSVSFNHFKHDLSQLTLLTDSFQNKQVGYIKAMHGLKTRLFFPGVKKLADSSTIAIVDANLTIKPVDNTYSSFRRPSRISALKVKNGGTLSATEDAIELGQQASLYGAELGSDGQYKLNITRYLQNLIKSGNTDFGLDIIRPGSGLYADRLVFGGPENQNHTLELKLKYIKLN